MSNSQSVNMEKVLGSSPTSVSGSLSLQKKCKSQEQQQQQQQALRLSQQPKYQNQLLSFSDFCRGIPSRVRLRQESKIPSGAKDDPVLGLFQRLDIQDPSWRQYVYFATTGRTYTRNLIATDGTTFTLLALCWDPSSCSPIHDHPCDGCWMKVLDGTMEECRYNARLECTRNETYTAGEVVFIHDAQGYHKVGNPTHTHPAVTLHLYSPPFQSCKTFCLNDPTTPCQSRVTNYSEYGTKL